jgi:hypothetical protein
MPAMFTLFPNPSRKIHEESVPATILIGTIVVGYEISNPDQLPFTWPRVGRGAIISTGHIAIETYERGGQADLAQYLKSLARDTGLKANLFDSSNHTVSGSASSLSADHAAQPGAWTSAAP